MTMVQSLASYTASFEHAGIPDAVMQRLKCFLLYNLCMGVAGYDAKDPVTAGISRMHAPAVGPGNATVLVTGACRTPADAAYANGAAITARGQNDTLRSASGHIGCIVIPAVMALAEARASRPVDVLVAMAAGYEAQAKLAKGAAAASGARGFRATSLYGVVGAAAASSRLLNLTAEQTAHALSISTSFAAGIMQCWADGSMEWRLQVAHASQAGVTAALLAEGGVIGAHQALEGEAGFYRAFAGATPTLDFSGWDLDDVQFKPYPGCAINQAPVDALLRLVRSNGLSDSDIAGITVTVAPSDYNYPGVRSYGPFASASGAIMSMPFMLMAALRDGIVRQRVFHEEYASSALHEASRKIRLESNEQIPRGHCRIAARLRNGAEHTGGFDDEGRFIFDWSQTLELVQDLAHEWPFDDACDRVQGLAQSVAELEAADSVAALLQHCCVSHGDTALKATIPQPHYL